MTDKNLEQVKEKFKGVEIPAKERYNILLDDLTDIIKETIYVCRDAQIKMKWEVGKRIIQEFQAGGHVDYKAICQRLEKDMKISKAEFYRCIQFAEKFPELENVWKLPEGKNLSWNKIKQKYLPDAALTKLALSFPHVESLDKWGIAEWWSQQGDQNFVLYINDPKYPIKLRVSIYKPQEEQMTPLKEAFKVITDYYVMLRGWDRKDMDAGDYARIHTCTRHLLLKSKGDVNKIKQAMDWVNRQEYSEWNMETVVKKYPDAMKLSSGYGKYLKKNK